ncbi:MAG: hypothetical protein ABFD10_10245 [Prolixibacteraceae bacterium]
MGLFNFLKQNHPKTVAVNENPLQETKKEISVEDRHPRELSTTDPLNSEINGIGAIYTFLQADYESKGYNDALTSPDDKYKAENIKLIKMDLQILIMKVDTYYKDLIRDLDFHIGSRTRAGLIDMVEELKTRKEMVIEHMEKVEELKRDTETDNGMTQRMILSYQRGFMRGLSAITQSNVLNKTL